MRSSILASSAIVVLLSACAAAPVTPIDYTPNPARVQDPAGEVRSLIVSNTVAGCISEPEFTSATTLVVRFVCTNGDGAMGNLVARLDRVANIALAESGGWYRVTVTHTDGSAEFFWTSRSRQDMERLADALAALSAGNAAQPAPPSGVSM